jgi:NADPH:quinone reductase-like Zn-dependent oxidoreductase
MARSGRHVVTTYQQIEVVRRGGPENLKMVAHEIPSPLPGEVLVRVATAGVSFGDVLLRVGVIPGGPKPPFTPGFDITGVVEAVGPEVAGLHPGESVTALVRMGGYSELLAVPANRAVPVPDGLDAVDVAAAALNYFVAYQMLHRIAQVKAGQRVLIHGAAGGVGTALLQLGKLAEVECYGTSSAGKRQLVTDLGGHHIDYRKDDFVRVMRDLPHPGADAVFDPVGGSYGRRSYKVVRRGGIVVGYGQSQALQDGKARRLVAIYGLMTGVLGPKLIPDGKRTNFYNAWSLEKKQPQAYAEDLSEVLALLAAGKIRPVLAQTLPLAEASKAHELLEQAAVSGKIVLVCGGRP